MQGITGSIAHNTQPANFFAKVAQICRFGVIIIGVAGILGVLFKIDLLRACIPNSIPISFTGSICFLIAGLALDIPRNTSFDRLSMTMAGIFIGLAGALTLAEYKFDFHILFDEIFVKHDHESATPSRMSISGSLNFLLAGIFFLTKWNHKKIYSEIPVLLILVIATIVATANLLNFSNPIIRPRVYSQPVHATIGFLLFATSAIFQRPCCGFISTFASKAQTSRSGFILLNLILFILSVITFVEYYGVTNSWFTLTDSLPVILVIYLLVFALVIERFTRITNKNELHKEILFREVQKKDEEVKNNLRELALYLQNSKEEESLHLASEIHDQLGQDLTIMKFHVNLLQEESKGTSSPSLNIISKYLDGTIDLVKRITTELRPQLLDDIGLIEAMQFHANEVQRIFNIDIITDIEVNELPPEVCKSTTIFRVFQEIMDNVAHHSKANHVYIHISQQEEPSILKISVTDDGIGFDPSQVKAQRKFGLTGMQERVLALKGNLQIISQPGEGACLLVEIPLETDKVLEV